MKNMLVGVFHAAGHAHDAHATLLDQGFRNGQVGVDAGASPPAGTQLHGLAGVIARMFSGFLTDGDPVVRAYHDTLARGGGIVALHDLDENEEARARAILRRHGAASVENLAPLAVRGRARRGSLTDPERELAAVASMGPRAYVLPNAPVDWGRYSGRSRASIAQTGDPARPEEELDDTVGLDPELDREQLTAAARANRKD